MQARLQRNNDSRDIWDTKPRWNPIGGEFVGLVETKLHMCPIMDTKTSNPTNLNAIFLCISFSAGLCGWTWSQVGFCWRIFLYYNCTEVRTYNLIRSLHILVDFLCLRNLNSLVVYLFDLLTYILFESNCYMLREIS